MKIGNREFDFSSPHTYVMGILNVTPDSFSDGGKFNQMDCALAHVECMIKEGVDIIDVGGESTRPGYEKISIEEETERVVGMLEAIKSRFDVPVSVDTYKAPVMMEALRAGADMANDIWGLRYDKFHAPKGQESVWECGTMAQILGKTNIPVCVMHNRPVAEYTNFMEEVLVDLRDSMEIGIASGIKKENMILDPGVGFAKSYENNMEVLAKLHEFHVLQMPLLLATSRKSVIGITLDLPVDEREEGTIVTTVLATKEKWNMVRVHDVKANVRAIKMTEAICKNDNIIGMK